MYRVFSEQHEFFTNLIHLLLTHQTSFFTTAAASDNSNSDNNNQQQQQQHAHASFSSSSSSSWALVDGMMQSNFLTQMLMSTLAMVLLVLSKWFIIEPLVQRLWAPCCRVDAKDLGKFNGYFFNLIVHVVPAFWCLNIVIRERWIVFSSSSSGGSGPNLDGDGGVWHKYPDQTQPLEYLYIYFLCNGYHFYRLLALFGKHEAKDLVEMSIHHVLTVFLLCTSMYFNYIRIGILVLMLNDQSDIWVYLAKGFGATRGWTRDILSKVCLVGVMASWSYWRIYTLAVVVLPIAAQHPHRFVSGDCCVAALCGLLMLNLYWFAIFLRIVYRLVAGKGFQDLTEEKAVDGRGFSKKDGSLTTGVTPNVSPNTKKDQ